MGLQTFLLKYKTHYRSQDYRVKQIPEEIKGKEWAIPASLLKLHLDENPVPVKQVSDKPKQGDVGQRKQKRAAGGAGQRDEEL